MPDYLAPGVYVEEVPSAVRPIAGVGTSTAGFVGISANIPDNAMPEKPAGGNYKQAAPKDPQPINNWEGFTQKFGDFQDANQYLAHAVYGFFNNGGTRCWVSRLTTVDDVDDAIDQFQAIDEIAIVAAPLPPEAVDATVTQAARNAIHTKLVSHCQLMENRVTILDSARDISRLVITTDDSGIWRPAADPKGYGAFYFPWIEVADMKPSAAPDARIAVPPSGHLAGIYARSVHKAPTNEVIMGALGVCYEVSKNLLETLIPNGVNCVRFFNGTIKVWGARTLASDPAGESEWKQVNVRRLVLFVEKSIERGIQWAVFEPNAEPLWAAVRRSVTNFLSAVWRNGALEGTKPEEAFFVKADRTTMTQNDIDNGRLIILVGIAPVKPSEFVIFRTSQRAGPGGR